MPPPEPWVGAEGPCPEPPTPESSCLVLQSQLCQFQQDITRREGSNSDLQMRLHELTSLLEDKEAFIKQQQEVK